MTTLQCGGPVYPELRRAATFTVADTLNNSGCKLPAISGERTFAKQSSPRAAA
jgi:hypothetical protein